MTLLLRTTSTGWPRCGCGRSAARWRCSATGDRACLDIASRDRPAAAGEHEDGTLTVSYEDLSWDGLLGWLRPHRTAADITITVPKDCPVQLGVVTASAIVSGISAATSVKSVSGDITLDGVTGAVDARTVSGDIEAQGLGGTIAFNSVSGDLTLADGSVDRLEAKTVSGRVTADIDLAQGAALRVTTVSGPVAIRLPADAQRPGGPAVHHRPGAERVRGPASTARSPAPTARSAGTLGSGHRPAWSGGTPCPARSRCCPAEPARPRADSRAQRPEATGGAADEPGFPARPAPAVPAQAAR